MNREAAEKASSWQEPVAWLATPETLLPKESRLREMLKKVHEGMVGGEADEDGDDETATIEDDDPVWITSDDEED